METRLSLQDELKIAATYAASVDGAKAPSEREVARRLNKLPQALNVSIRKETISYALLRDVVDAYGLSIKFVKKGGDS